MRRLMIALIALSAVGLQSPAGRADGFDSLSESYRAFVLGGGVVSEGVGLANVQPGPDGILGTGDDTRGSPGPSASAAIDIGGIPDGARVVKAFLYWAVLATDDMDVVLQGQPVAGTMIGRSQETCWFNIRDRDPAQDNRVYRADVTELVTGNGSYVISGVGEMPPGDAQGASLVVVYSRIDDPWATLVVVGDGSISGGVPGPQADNMSHAFAGLSIDRAPLGARLHTGMADSNANFDDGVMSFAGAAVTPANYFAGSDGGLYDDITVDLPVSLVPPGTQAVSNAIAIVDDCLLWMYSALEVHLEPPPVAIVHPAQDALLNTGNVAVSGHANEEVASVRLSEGASTLATVEVTDGTWSSTLGFADGAHTVVATGLDLLGGAINPAVEVSFTVDTQAPAVVITAPKNAAASFGAVQVRGTAGDNRAVRQVIVTYQNALMGVPQQQLANCAACAAGSVQWDARLQLHEVGVYLVTATAYDTAGNTTTTAPALIIIQAVPD